MFCNRMFYCWKVFGDDTTLSHKTAPKMLHAVAPQTKTHPLNHTLPTNHQPPVKAHGSSASLSQEHRKEQAWGHWRKKSDDKTMLQVWHIQGPALHLEHAVLPIHIPLATTHCSNTALGLVVRVFYSCYPQITLIMTRQTMLSHICPLMHILT